MCAGCSSITRLHHAQCGGAASVVRGAGGGLDRSALSPPSGRLRHCSQYCITFVIKKQKASPVLVPSSQLLFILIHENTDDTETACHCLWSLLLLNLMKMLLWSAASDRVCERFQCMLTWSFTFRLVRQQYCHNCFLLHVTHGLLMVCDGCSSGLNT